MRSSSKSFRDEVFTANIYSQYYAIGWLAQFAAEDFAETSYFLRTPATFSKTVKPIHTIHMIHVIHIMIYSVYIYIIHYSIPESVRWWNRESQCITPLRLGVVISANSWESMTWQALVEHPRRIHSTQPKKFICLLSNCSSDGRAMQVVRFLVLGPHPLSFHLICTSAVYGLKPFINLSLGHAWSETTCRARRNEGLALICGWFCDR